MTASTVPIVSIVEDSKEIGQSLKKFLNRSDTLCCDNHYLNALDALDGIPGCKPDIVIMDIGLPDLSGVECMKRLKKELEDTAFIMFTVFDTDDILFDALKFGASGYILKEHSFDEIYTAIHEVMNGGAPMSPNIARKVIDSFKISNDSSAHLEKLTDHQLEILRQISLGLLNKEIAHNLNIKEGTVKVQVSQIYKKLQVNNRVEAINKYRQGR